MAEFMKPITEWPPTNSPGLMSSTSQRFNNESDGVDGTLVCCDALDLLQAIPEECADILFLDPPFNLGKQYGSKSRKADRLLDSDYMDFMQHILERAMLILKPGGALYLYHLPHRAFQFANLLNEKLSFRHWIAISMKNGFARGQRLYPAHYALLYFTKGEPAAFNRPKINPPKCRKCKQYIRDYGGYERYVRDGINLSDFWDDLSPVRHSKYKTRTSNELPLKLVQRVVAISGTPGGLLVDPFVGSGTTLVAAQESQMDFIAGDYDRENYSIAAERLRDQDTLTCADH